MVSDEISSKERHTQIPLDVPLWAVNKHRKPTGREKEAEQIPRKKRSPNSEPVDRVVGSETALVTAAPKVRVFRFSWVPKHVGFFPVIPRTLLFPQQ